MSYQRHNEADEVGQRRAAGGLNLASMIIIMVLAFSLLWFLLSGPMSSLFGGEDVEITPGQRQEPLHEQQDQQPPDRQPNGPGGLLPGLPVWAS